MQEKEGGSAHRLGQHERPASVGETVLHDVLRDSLFWFLSTHSNAAQQGALGELRRMRSDHCTVLTLTNNVQLLVQVSPYNHMLPQTPASSSLS